MALPRKKSPRRYWESLSDEELLRSELNTDDPEALENLVFEVPPGDEEAYVEFKYDLRGSGRTEEFSCVHGHHKHLAGFVMRKGNERFLVGWMCGKTIYGEDFDQYKADFDAAVNRQQTLRRRREIEEKTAPFVAWLEALQQSDAFKGYDSVRGQLKHRLPWVWENVPRAVAMGQALGDVPLPKTFFKEETDPRLKVAKAVMEAGALASSLITAESLEEKIVANIKRVLKQIIERLEEAFVELKDAEDFFQPAVLRFVCDLANRYDNPKKRKYFSDLNSLTCKRGRDKSTVQLPSNYRVPDRRGLDELKEALRTL